MRTFFKRAKNLKLLPSILLSFQKNLNYIFKICLFFPSLQVWFFWLSPMLIFTPECIKSGSFQDYFLYFHFFFIVPPSYKIQIYTHTYRIRFCESVVSSIKPIYEQLVKKRFCFFWIWLKNEISFLIRLDSRASLWNWQILKYLVITKKNLRLCII